MYGTLYWFCRQETVCKVYCIGSAGRKLCTVHCIGSAGRKLYVRYTALVLQAGNCMYGALYWFCRQETVCKVHCIGSADRKLYVKYTVLVLQARNCM
jgi:hypothetical protein